MVVLYCLVLLLTPSLTWAQLTPEDIADLKAQAEVEGWTFDIGENDATRYSISELTGLVIPEDWGREAEWDPSMPLATSIPTSFDWRDRDGVNMTTPVKNQGGCGSCWAFSAIGAMEQAILIQTGYTVDLSEQWLVSCTNAGTCEGGWTETALNYLKCDGATDDCSGGGAVMEQDFTYQFADTPCNCPYRHPYCLTNSRFAGQSGGVPTPPQIKQAIMTRGPVSVGVRVNGAFHAYNGGVFNACDNESPINHAVVLVGWDDAMGTEGVWIMRNSWGPNWGDDGHMYIEYGCSRIGLGTLYVTYEPRDCNSNGMPDEQDVYDSVSSDCSGNKIPDECEPDCNNNGQPDSCDIVNGVSADCTNNEIPDECEPDCNNNGQPDDCDIEDWTSPDCNRDGIPDECSGDCNNNGFWDVCDLKYEFGFDYNENGLLDECETIELPTRLYVDASAPAGGDGTSWSNAMNDLRIALQVAKHYPGVEEMWIAAGLYKPSNTGDPSKSFELSDGLKIYGGFAGWENSLHERHWQSNFTILSGDLDGNDVPMFWNRSDNSYRVVTAKYCGDTTLLDGFVISGGNGGLRSGAGVYIFQSQLTIRNTIVINSISDIGGGGVCNHGPAATARLENCIIAYNLGFKGGMENSLGAPEIINSIFWGNAGSSTITEENQIAGEIPTINYSVVEGWTDTMGGEGNSGENPMFRDWIGPDGLLGTMDDNYRPMAGSPTINAGDPSMTFSPGAADLMGHPRVLCGRIDIGPFEMGIGDYDCNGNCEMQDLAGLASCLAGPTSSVENGCQSFDFNADGDVDLLDFTALQVILSN